MAVGIVIVTNFGDNMNEKIFLLLQINDSQFPIGSYSHSYGLETYVQQGYVHNGATAEEFLLAFLENSLLYSELLPVKLAFTYGLEGNIEKLSQLEALSLASRSPRELREASLKLGKRFFRTVEGLPVDFSLEFFQEYGQVCGKIGMSHPVAYGVFCACGGFSENLVYETYLYSQISGFITNCVKLIPLSQTEGQKIACSLQKHFPKYLEILKNLQEEDVFLSCPALDLRSMEHERLYSRLYMS